jgi:hypothetical protein
MAAARWAPALLLACACSAGAPRAPDEAPAAPDASTPAPDGGASSCDVAAIFARPANGCANEGCHGVQHRGDLDLVSPDLARRLLDKPSAVAACAGRKVIDAASPERSLLLSLVDPARFEAHGCGVMMPLGGRGVDAADLACLEDFVGQAVAAAPPVPDPRAAFEPAAPETQLAKVKSLLVGAAPTQAELLAIQRDPAALRGLIDGWMETPAFAEKLQTFLGTALQQDALGRLREGLGFPPNRPVATPLFRENLETSFARTAWRLVRERRPFTEVLTTDRWEMTTALLVLLAFADQSEAERALTHRILRAPGPGMPNPMPADYSVANRVWVFDHLPEDCEFRPPNQSHFLGALFGRLQCRGSRDHRYPPLVGEADMRDWRTVRLTPAGREGAPLFYDLERLRGATEVPLRIPRRGFFTTPVFLDSWQTNEDNQFRVTTNQTLIGALHATVAISDPTAPVSTAGLDAEHAAPGSDCHGCHRLLDPMRLFFGRELDYRYQRSGTPETRTPSFALRGHTFSGGGLVELAEGLAAHPRFAVAWAQKLCLYANSSACAEDDPEFLRVVRAFEQSQFDLLTLVRELFASPLVTHAAFTDTHAVRPPSVSITRARHLCAALKARVGDDVCAGNASILGLIPDDEVARGQVDPVLTSETSAFHVAATERLCSVLSAQVVGRGRAYEPQSAEEAVGALVEGLMGLPAGHPRHDAARAALRDHFAEARASGAAPLLALRSTFIVACTSPDVMAIGL